MIALAAALAIAGCASGPAGTGGAGRTTGDTDRVTDEIKIVAIALGGGPAAQNPSPGRVYVDDRYCRIIDADRRGPCVVRPIPASVRQGVLQVVGPAYRFVGRTLSPSRTRVAVALGAPVIRGDTATIAVDSMCGPLCGSGTRIHLHRDGGRWHEVGSRKTDWIS